VGDGISAVTLRLARVGGACLLAGGVTFLVVLAMVLGNQPVGAGMSSIGGLTFDLGLVFLAIAPLVLAVAGEGPVSAIGARVGLVVMAFGIALILASSVVMRLVADPWTPAILQVLLGIPATIIGLLVLGVSLVRRGGPPKLVGQVLLAGIALLLATVLLSTFGRSDLRFYSFAAPMGGFAAALIATAIAGIGYLAMSDRWSWR
jgi:peptidoglycan/LPS O-acetylase OafA/YrhL